MAMNPQDFELIALSHVLTRYRLTGELPTISGQPFDIKNFKTQLFAGVPDYNPDININIDTVKMENTVVDCDNEHEQKSEPVATVATVATQDEPPVAEPTPPEPSQESIIPEKSSIGGKLFHFFSKDNKNDSQ